MLLLFDAENVLGVAIRLETGTETLEEQRTERTWWKKKISYAERESKYDNWKVKANNDVHLSIRYANTETEKI